MITIILVGIAVAVLFFVLKPLFSSRTIEPLINRKTDRGLRHDDLFAEKMKVYGHIKDIDLEYRMGKIDEADYRRVRTEYLAKAAEVLDKLQALQHKRDGKSEKPSPVEEPGETGPRDEKCPSCGVVNSQEHKFCPECGEPLLKAVAEGR